MLTTAPHEEPDPSRPGTGMRMRSALEHAFTHAPIGHGSRGHGRSLAARNGAMCRVTGYTRLDVCARSLRDLSDPRDVDIDAPLPGIESRALALLVARCRAKAHCVANSDGDEALARHTILD
jgi:hypothetical protein